MGKRTDGKGKGTRRRRRGRRLLVLGGMAAATWMWRSRQIAANERRFMHPLPPDADDQS